MPKTSRTRVGLGQASKKVELINRINNVIYSERDFQHTFKSIIKQLGKFIPLHQAGIALIDAVGENVTLHFVSTDARSRLKTGDVFALKGTSIEAVTKLKRPMLIRNLASEGMDDFGRSLLEEGFISVIIIPLYIKGTVIGTFHLACKSTKGYTESELDLVEPLKRQVGLALENSHLSDMLRNRLKKLALINQLSETAATILDFSDLFHFLVQRIKEVFRCDRVFILIKDKQNKEYVFQTANEPVSKIRRARSKRRERSEFSERADLFSESSIGKNYFPIARTTKSALCSPIRVEDDLIGEILVESDRPGHFDKEDLYLIQLVPNYLKFIIKKAQMHEHIKLLNKQLRAKNSELLIANTELKNLYEQKSNLLNFLSHELKSPLMAIMGYIGLLERRELGDLNPQQQEIIKDISQICNRLIDLSNVTLTHAKLESYVLKINAQKEDLSKCINQIAKDFYLIANKKNMKLRVEVPEDLPKTYCDVEKIELALKNLLDNAIKYSKFGGVVRIAARRITAADKFQHPALNKFLSRYRSSREGSIREFVEISVRDSGVAIPRKYQKKIFNQYFQVPSNSSANGLGLGLYLSKQIIRAHDGYIWVEDLPGGGNKFSFVIPVQAEV